MLLDMTQLLGGAVDRLDFSYTLSADRVPYEGAEALLDGENTDAQRIGDNEENEGIYPIVFDDVVVLEPVAVNGSVINRAGYITLTAEASMSYRTHCARCLAEVEDTVRFLCEKTVADEKGLLRLENTENDDYVQIKGGKLDLDAPICDEILLGFPMRILCSDGEYLDGVNISNSDIYRYLKNGEYPKTSLPSAEDFDRVLDQIKADG